MKFSGRVFMSAGIYGILALLPLYFLEDRLGREQPPPFTHPEFYYGFAGVALSWQWLFLVIARDPIRFRPAMLPAVLEKFSFGGATIVLFAQGRLSTAGLGAGLIDLILGALFLVAYRLTPRSSG